MYPPGERANSFPTIAIWSSSLKAPNRADAGAPGGAVPGDKERDTTRINSAPRLGYVAPTCFQAFASMALFLRNSNKVAWYVFVPDRVAIRT